MKVANCMTNSYSFPRVAGRVIVGNKYTVAPGQVIDIPTDDWKEISKNTAVQYRISVGALKLVKSMKEVDATVSNLVDTEALVLKNAPHLAGADQVTDAAKGDAVRSTGVRKRAVSSVTV